MFVCKQHTYICLCSFTWTAFDVLGCNLVLWVWFCEIRFWKSWFPLAFYQTHPSNSILLNLLNSLLPFICDMGGLSCCLGGYTEMSLNNGWGTGRGMFCCTKVRLDDCYQRNDKFLSFKKKKKNQQKNLAMELSQKFDHYILPSKYPFFWNKCLIWELLNNAVVSINLLSFITVVGIELCKAKRNNPKLL